MSLEEKLSQAKTDLKHNEMVELMYNQMIKQAEEYYAQNHKKIDDLTIRQLGVCKWYRGEHPETTKTDVQILDYIDTLEEKYANE